LLSLERGEGSRADDLAAIVEDRAAAIALDDGGVGLEHALAADVLLEARDAPVVIEGSYCVARLSSSWEATTPG